VPKIVFFSTAPMACYFEFKNPCFSAGNLFTCPVIINVSNVSVGFSERN
jgi:hypothetical protein